MSDINLNHQDVLTAEARIPSGLPVTMMNLVAFRAEAAYDDPQERHVPA